MASTSEIAEEESCSSNSVPHGREDNGHYKKTIERERKELDKIPRQEEEQNLLIFNPATWFIQVLVFQAKIITQAFAFVSWVFNSCYSAVVEPVHRTVQAKDRATEAVSQKLAMISQVPPTVTEGGGLMMRKLGFGCLAATYVCTMLIVLTLFALFLGLAFMTLWFEEPVTIRNALYFDYTQPHPSALVSFIPSDNMQAGVRQSHKASARRLIPAGHKFYVTVILVMPESDHNRQIGMFQVMAELISDGNKILARSSHPCMLRFRSAQVRHAKTFLMGIPLLLGISEETQTVVVRLIDYQEKNVPTESVKITLQPKAGTAKLPELYSSEIDIHSQLPWIKEFTRNWKWTFCVWSSLTFYFLLVGLVICCCKQVLLPRASATGKTDKKQLRADTEDLHSTLIDSGLSEPSRRHSRSKSKRRVSFAEESAATSVISAHNSISVTARRAD